MKTIAIASMVLALATAWTSFWLLNQRAYSVFDARSDGFDRGVAYARAQQEFEGKLGLCVYASLACDIKPKGKK